MAQTLEAEFHQGHQKRIDHTPSGAAVASGQIVNLDGLVGICTTPGGIADGKLGSLDIDGMYRIKKGAVAFTKGDLVEWDDTANTAVAQAGGTFDLGVAYQSAASGDAFVLVWINKQALQ